MRNCAMLLAGLSLSLFTPLIAHARPAHKQAVAEHFAPFLAKKLNDCTLCHLPDPPKSRIAGDKPHNAFGKRLAAVKKELARAGKKTDIVSRVQAIAEEDADGDGVTNLLEILSGHFPGDPKDTPTADEVVAARKTLV